MDEKSFLKKYYSIVDELDKNITRFTQLEKELEIAKANNDLELANTLLKEYKKISNNIKILKEKSEELNKV